MLLKVPHHRNAKRIRLPFQPFVGGVGVLMSNHFWGISISNRPLPRERAAAGAWRLARQTPHSIFHGMLLLCLGTEMAISWRTQLGCAPLTSQLRLGPSELFEGIQIQLPPWSTGSPNCTYFLHSSRPHNVSSLGYGRHYRHFQHVRIIHILARQLTYRSSILLRRDTVMVAIAGFTVLVWDHLITLADEVELIWKWEKGLLVYLFLLNRYLTPLGFIVNLVAFTLPGWGTEHFVRYEGAMSCVGTQIAALIMSLRVRAIYNNSKVVVYSLTLLFLAWIGVNAWLLTHGEVVQHISGVHSCSMIFDPSLSVIASAWGWLPLLYDTIVFALMLRKTLPSIRKGHAGRIVRTLFADGTLYYSVIFAVNLTLTVMIVRADQGVKNIAAQLELLLTVTMVSRITLNLRRQALCPVEDYRYPISREWTTAEPTRTTRSRSGSGLTGGTGLTRPRGYLSASRTHRQNGVAAPNLNDISFSIPDRFQLSTIFSSNGTPHTTVTPTPSSPISEEIPRRAGREVEGM